jgi:hypothetical protein
VVGKKEEENIAAVMVMVMVVSIVGVVGDYIYISGNDRGNVS